MLRRRLRRRRPLRGSRRVRRAALRRPRLLRAVRPRITSGVHFFKRTVDWTAESATNINASGVGWLIGFNPGNVALNYPAGGAGGEMYCSVAHKFQLLNLPNVTEFANLFDQYSIRKVVVKLYPWTNSAEATPIGNLTHSTTPIVHYCIDHDDFNMYNPSPSGVNEMRQRNNYKTTRLFRPLTIIIKPRVNGLVAKANGAAVAGLNMRAGWLDMADLAVDHFAVKMIFCGINPGAAGSFCMRAENTYYFKTKGVR